MGNFGWAMFWVVVLVLAYSDKVIEIIKATKG